MERLVKRVVSFKERISQSNCSRPIDRAFFITEKHEHSDGQRGEERQRSQHAKSTPRSRADEQFQLPNRLGLLKTSSDSLAHNADEIERRPIEDVPLTPVPNENVGETAEYGQKLPGSDQYCLG